MMRPASMTAFGRGEFKTDNRQWTVEIRSVNHRFCDISIKMSRKYAALEDNVKKTVAAVFARGHIDVSISQATGGTLTAKLATNLALAREYQQALQDLQESLQLTKSPTLRLLAEYPGIISQEEAEENLEEVNAEIDAALRQALTGCQKMREDEGQRLKEDLLARLDEFSTIVETIETRIPELLEQKKTSLKERLAKMLDGIDLDPTRLAQEVAIIADKSDVTEELVRLKCHIQQFQAFMGDAKPVGRRLDFLLQEFLREINTLASKINDTEIIHKTVELKNEAEKLREQVQNLE